MVKIKIHRGSHQIGGSIIEIYTENTHIFVDFGAELNADPEKSTDDKMIDMINHASCDAILFTHYHGDHIGLLEYVPKTDINGRIIELRMGETAKEVLKNVHKTLAENKDEGEEFVERHKQYLAILDDNRTITFKNKEIFTIGDFKITPIMVDHSAYDAYMYIIEAEGKVIVHTGDFRTHGRLGENFFENLAEDLKDIKTDVLITEGTMMSRLNEEVDTEEELEQKATELLSKYKYAFLICSSTNVESLASFANAAYKKGKAFFVNYYVYEQICLYNEVIKDDRIRFKRARKFEPIEWYNYKLGSTQMEFMEKNGFLMLIGTSESYKKRMDRFMEKDPLLIYSMWDGYVKKDKELFRRTKILAENTELLPLDIKTYFRKTKLEEFDERKETWFGFLFVADKDKGRKGEAKNTIEDYLLNKRPEKEKKDITDTCLVQYVDYSSNYLDNIQLKKESMDILKNWYTE